MEFSANLSQQIAVIHCENNSVEKKRVKEGKKKGMRSGKGKKNNGVGGEEC